MRISELSSDGVLFRSALGDIRKQWKRNRVAFQTKDEDVPVYPTIASQFNDPGISWMFVNLCRLLREKLHLGPDAPVCAASARSEGRRIGDECVRKCRTRWSAYY